MSNKNLSIDDVIIENEKDQIIFDYLMEIRGKSGIEYILKKYFSGATKPYISNIVKYGKIEIPNYLFSRGKLLNLDERKAILNDLKQKLHIKK